VLARGYLFEEGVKLVKLCNSKLDNAEQKVKILVNGEDGPEEKDFSGKNE
jgi:exonuclease VII small subunit